jgi:4-amino-4-deoxy-L-arabinose transferase-like glycosyltransferase
MDQARQIVSTQSAPAPDDRRLAQATASRDAVPIVIALAAILFFARLGVRALWASEFRWAEIAREMLISRNYFWPTINGHVYYDKPLGSYWLVIGATWLTGGMNEAAARLPSAIAGLIAIALLIFLSRRLYDLPVGVMASMILATSFSFVFFSRSASADVETVAGVLAALTLFWCHQDHPTGWWVVALWVVMALTSLTKGLLGFVLPLVVIGSYASLADGWAVLAEETLHGSFSQRLNCVIARQRWFFNWFTPLAIVLAALIYYWPFAVSHAETGSAKGLAMVYRENVVRYFAPFDHVGPFYLYAYVIFALMAPWSVFLPAALAQAHYPEHLPNPAAHAEHHQSDRFTLTFFWPTFIFFTVSGSRRSYYLLPILPAAAILVARLFTRSLDQLNRAPRTMLKLGFSVLVIAVVVSSLAFVSPRYFLPNPYALLPDAPARRIFAIGWIGSVLAIGWAVRRLTTPRIFLSSAIVAWLFMFYLFVFAMPAGDAWRGEKQFAQQTRELIGGDTAGLAYYRSLGPAYYLDLPAPVPSYDSRRRLDQAINAGAARWVVMRQRDIETMDLPAQVLAREAVYPWDSKDHRLNAMVLVRLGK